MVTDRQRRCEFVDWFVVNYREALLEALTRVFEKSLGRAVPDLGFYLDGQVSLLRGSLRELVAAEQAHLDEIANDGVFRDRRDQAAQALREVVFNWRPVIRAVFGERKAEEAGFERRIADHPLALLRQTERLLSRLNNPQFALDATRFEGVAVTRDKIVEQLEKPARQLRQVMDDLTSEQTKAHGTKVAKDKATADFDEAYQLFVGTFRPAFRLVGEHELSERLTLKLSRRPGQSEEPEEDREESSDAPEPGDDDEPP
jgi:hypothetical protein